MADMMTIEDQFTLPKGCFANAVTEVQHYTDRLFRFRTERPQSFRFRSGEFVMIALPAAKPIWRAYSVASPSWDEALEFFSIKVEDGPLTKDLQKIKPGDTIWMRQKPTGTLVHDALIPGKRLYMISTGTGIAPFASLMRDPETYEKFDEVILTHTTRQVAELQYGIDLVEELRGHEFLSEFAEKLVHYPSVTQEPYARQGRITTLLSDGTLYNELGIPPLDPATDRVMICGSMGLNTDIKAICEASGLTEGANNKPAEFVLEKAFVG